jgi:hypothetical protein
MSDEGNPKIIEIEKTGNIISAQKISQGGIIQEIVLKWRGRTYHQQPG